MGELRVDGGFLFKYPPHMGISIGYGVFLGSNVVIDAPPGSILELGNKVNLTKDIVVAVAENISVGDNVLVAEFTSIRDADHGIAIGLPISDQPMRAKPVIIGDDVWIGRGVAILKGARIGNGAVIGANAVVTSDIPPYAIAVGSPARIIRYREEIFRNEN